MSGDNNVNMDELATAFESGAKSGGDKKMEKREKRDKRGKRGVRKWAVGIFAIGLIALVGGVIFFAIRQNQQPPMEDKDFLMSAGEWVEEDNPTVIWDFTESDKGKLTTDGHLNNYDFTWTLEDGKLTIKTAWLYNLNDEFDYVLDQGAKVLTITNAEKGIEVRFKAQERKTDNGSGEENNAENSEN